MEMFWEEVEATMKMPSAAWEYFGGLCGVLLYESKEILTYFASNLKKIWKQHDQK